MKNYLKKLLVGLLVAAMTVTNINYVPANAESVVGDELITSDLDPTMSNQDKWSYDNAWFGTDEGAGFSTSSFAKNSNDFYKADAGAEASVVSKTSFSLKAGIYTLKFKVLGANTNIYPYVSGKVTSSVVSASNNRGNPEEKELTFVVKNDTSNVNLGLSFVSTGKESAWFDVSDISIKKTADLPSEVTVYVDYTGGSDLPFFTFGSEIEGKTYAFSPWSNAYAYPMKDESETIGEGWYSFTAEASVFGSNLEIVRGTMSGGTYSYSGWVSKTDYENYSSYLAGGSVYLNFEFTNIASTLDDYNAVEPEKHFYIGGRPQFFVGETDYYGDNWSVFEMTKEEDGTFTYKLGAVKKGDSVEHEIYSNKDWLSANGYDTDVIKADGYLMYIYDSVNNVLTYKLYDETYTNEVEIPDEFVTLHVYYPDSDVLTAAFDTAKVNASKSKKELGKEYSKKYWGKTCYSLKKDKKDWYSIKIYDSFGPFQIVANPQNETWPDDSVDKEGTEWIVNFGGNDNEGDQERYDTLFEGEKTYIMYNTLFDSVEKAEAYDKAHAWDFYIAGSTSDFEPKCDKGIFTNYWAQDNYHKVEGEDRYTGDANWLDQMTKSSDNKKLTWTSKVKAKKFETYALNVYADQSWFGKVWKNNYSFLSVADAYVKITYDFAKSEFSVEYFNDAACKTPTVFKEKTINYYYGVTGAKDLYLAFNVSISGKKSTKTYWGRKCYPMTEVGNGWYVFKGYKDVYGGFQVVVNPQNENFGKGDKEDKNGTIWQTDIGDYGDISTSDSNLSRFKALLKAGNKVYIKYNKVFSDKLVADAFTNWTYYVAGSTSDFTNTNAGKGIFSNYWAGTYVKGVDDDGKAYEKKEDTWPDVLTKEKDNVYSVKLGRAIKGTTYSFNVYTEKDWNASNLTGAIGAPNPEFKATSNNYVKLYFYRDLKKGNNTWAIKYFADKDCKVKAKLSAPKGVKVKSLKATKGAKVKLSWKAVAGASKYVIYANGKKVASTKKTAKAINYKKAGKTIKYTVVAKGNEYAASKASKAVKVKTPGKIKKIKAKGVKGAVKVTWKKVKKSNGYVIYRSTKKKKGFKKIGLVKGAKKTKFLDKKAAKGKKYFYKVYTFKKNGKKAKVYSKASKVASAKSK